MTLAPGARLGPYEILGALGAGGMGEVYKAKDARLDRFVAIKVLPEHLAKHPESLARFEREAKAVAALNHPNITGIFDLGREGDTVYAVMELLEGEPLRSVLQAGPLTPRRATELAVQLAQGLAAAHGKGVVHRDLKPENLWLTLDGRLKILDFGLAKQVVSAPSGAHSFLPTEAISGGHHTEQGMILGTLGYMSPEQVRGEAVDARSDIFSFGVVLFELLTGRKAFARETSADTMAALLKEEPPELDDTSRPVPAGLRRVVAHCLEKRPALRFQSAQDLVFALQNSDTSSAFPAAPAASARRGATWAPWSLAGAALVLSLGLWLRAPQPAASPVRKFALPLQDLLVRNATSPLLSPDGRHLAYLTAKALWIRDLDQLEPRKVLEGGHPRCLAWSPDSAHLAFIVERQIRRIPAAGGAASLVCEFPMGLGAQTPGLAWLADGRIVFAPASSGSGLYAVAADGGELSLLLARAPGEESDFHKPSVLPDGRSLLFVVDSNKRGPDSLAVLREGKRQEIFRVPGDAREVLDAPVYSPTGHILFTRSEKSPGIWALPFSLSRLEATGAPFLVVAGGRWPSLSRDGLLLYCGSDDSRSQLLVVDRNRKALKASVPSEFAHSPAFSPDGTRIAWCARELLVWDLRRDANMRLTFNLHLNQSPAWSPKGDRIYYTGREGGGGRQIWAVPADGTGQAAPLQPGLKPEEEFGAQPSPSRDGRWLFFSRLQADRGFDLFALDLSQGGKVREVLSTPGSQTHPSLSPDGTLLLYQSDESGRMEVHLRSFPEGAGHWQASTRGGSQPRWSFKGDRIYYLEGDALMEVEVTRAPAPILGTPKKIFDLDGKPALQPGYDVSPDGRSFAFVHEIQPEGGPPKVLTLVEHWEQEFMRRKAP